MGNLSSRSVTVLVLALLALAFIALEAINGRLWLNDFRVYWEASGRFLRGEAPYGEAFGLGSGYFKYAPSCLFLFAPLALLPYAVASALWAAAVGAAVVLAVTSAERIVRERLLVPQAPFSPVITALATLVVAVHFHRELHLGNVNALLLVLLLVVVNDLLDGLRARAGILLGIALLFKPHFVVLLPLLVLHRHWRTLGFTAITLGASVVLPVVAIGGRRTMDLHVDWSRAVAAHNASFFHTGGESTRTAADTIHSVLWRLSGGHLPTNTATAAIIIGLIALAILAFALRLRATTGREEEREQRDLLFILIMLVAMVPNLVPTDTEHFLFSLPLVFYLVRCMFHPGRPRWLVWVGIVVLLAYGGNWQDVWGSWSDVLADSGVLGAANVALLLLCGVLYARNRRRAA